MHFNRIFCFLTAIAVGIGGIGCKKELPQSTENETETAENDHLDRSFVDRVHFLGDSTTAHMQTRAPLSAGGKSTQIWASRSRFLNLDPKITYTKILCPGTDEEMTIGEVAARVRPPYLVVTLGIDYGVYYYRDRPDRFAFYYEKLLDTIQSASPDTVLILQSIFPVARESAVITNDMVDAANRVVSEIAEQRGLYYLDSNSALRDDAGYLAPAYCSSADGIHLTEAAYKVVFACLAAAEAKITKEKERK